MPGHTIGGSERVDVEEKGRTAKQNEDDQRKPLPDRQNTHRLGFLVEHRLSLTTVTRLLSCWSALAWP